MERTAEVTCQHCGKPFRVIPSRLKHGRGRSCSPACQYAAIRARPKHVVTLTCIGCRATFTLPPSHAGGGRGKGKYCSRPCRDRNRIGVLHPQYIGAERPNYRGPNWMAQKRKARRRDNRTCQECGEPGPDVHHIRPFRLFTDYLTANQLSNLVTLCKPCHRRADALLQVA